MNQLELGIALPMASRAMPAARLLAELTEEVRAAEAAGLDIVLVPEHHAGPPGSLTAPLTVAAWLLARTSTIRVGTGVLLLPLHSPVHVAEAAAILHEASGGRLVLGVGAGYHQADFDLFGVDRSRRGGLLEAGMQTLSRAWASQAVAGVSVRPTIDGAQPRLWLGAWSAAGVRRAARLGDGWIADPIRSVAEIESMAKQYRDAAAKAARPSHVVVMREGWVDVSVEAARAVYEPAVAGVYRYYVRNGAAPAASAAAGDAVADMIIVGSSAQVASQLAQLVDRTGANTVVMALRHPAGPPHEQVLAAIERLGREVLPQVRRAIDRGVEDHE